MCLDVRGGKQKRTLSRQKRVRPQSCLRRPTPARVEAYGGLFAKLGALSVVGVEAASDQELTMQLTGKPGIRHMTISAAAPYTRAAALRFEMVQGGSP